MRPLDTSSLPLTCHGRWMSREFVPGLASIIIPTYNRSRFLVEAMNSVRAQTYRPVELIVVDDGSTDETPSVVQEWGSRQAAGRGLNLRSFRQENRGAPVARNRGLLECRGEYILFLDSDDLIGRSKIAGSVARLQGSGALSVAHGPWRCLYSRPFAGCGPLEPAEAFGDEAGRLRAYIGGRAGVPLCAYLFRRQAARAIGPWDERLRQRQDTDYVVRALLAGCRFVAERESITYYRRHGLEHVGHPANFRRHFPSLLYLADKWHGFLLDGMLPPHAAPALRACLAQLMMEAQIVRYAQGIARCRQRLRDWFGEAGRPPRVGAAVLARRMVLRPFQRAAGELPLAYAKRLFEATRMRA